MVGLHGHVEVAAWIFEVGSAGDIRCIRTKDEHGITPMHAACANGHLDVIGWLFEVGAAEDIHIEDCLGRTPLSISLDMSKMLTSLLVQGCTNDCSDHVADSNLRPLITVQDGRGAAVLGASLQLLVSQHDIFTSTVLTAVRFGSPLPPGRGMSAAKRCVSFVASPLLQLRGHEGTIVSLVADFVGLLRGRQLRNAREGLQALQRLL